VQRHRRPIGDHGQVPNTEASSGWRWRASLIASLAQAQDGVVHRAQLRERGIGHDAVRTEVRAGRWRVAGRHTVVVGPGGSAAALWRAVWESGPGARLDGAAALVAQGMTGFVLESIDVTVPRSSTRPASVVPGVRVHRPRRPAPGFPVGIPRVRAEWAALNAARWARSERQAALLICLPVQQRLVTPNRLMAAWSDIGRCPRHGVVGQLLADVCDGGQSLGELDLGRLVRGVGLPKPTRQVVRTTPQGRVYLDAAWEEVGLVVEIDGGHHQLTLNPIDDALRQNEITLGNEVVLRIPLLGLRLRSHLFAEQLARAYRVLRDRRAA